MIEVAQDEVDKKLKPCPFCGSSDVHYSYDYDYYAPHIFVIYCNGCDGEFYSKETYSKEQCVKWWNKRSGK